MATEKDRNFVNFLMEQTHAGKVKWEPTASRDEYAAGVKGKYKVIITQMDLREGYDSVEVEKLILRDVDDRALIEITSREWNGVSDLYELARRNALNVDAALDEIMGDATGDEDIPFGD